MAEKDIRWILRFSNYKKALFQLSRFIEKGELNEFEVQGLIQSFAYTHELAWKTLKDFLEHRGNKDIYGSKDSTREAFKLNILSNGEVWMEMIKSRNQTTHTYNEAVAKEISSAIISKYFQEFQALQTKLDALALKESN